jgi:starch synthase
VNLRDIPPANPQKDYAAPRILFIGIDFVRKGGPQLLEAFRIVRGARPDAELHIVGPETIRDHSPGVVFHGRLSKSDPAQKIKLESLFRESSVFVMPSLYEPFGIAPLEAMLYQLPCVVTDAWALREIVTPGFNGDLVPRGSIDAIATKLLQLLSDPKVLAVMGQHGRDVALHGYTWTVVASRMLTAMEHLRDS